jgi:hypothetical protein
MRGQQGEFYMPNLTADLPAVALTGGTSTMTLPGANWHLMHGSDTVRRAVAVTLSDGTVLLNRISSWANVSGDSRATMVSAWPVTVAPSGIRSISWCPVCRLASDSITIAIRASRAHDRRPGRRLMAFETKELSRTQGTPATLYHFAYGEDAAAYFAYTDAEQLITFDGVAYQPLPIMRGSIATQGTLDKAVLDIQLPTTSGLAELYKLYAPTRIVIVIVRQGHVGESDWPAIWVGRIINISRTGNQAVLSCEPVSTSMRRPGLRRHYQYGCMHALYGPMCKANRTAATTSSTVSSIAGNVVTLPSGWNGARAAAKYAGDAGDV